MEKTIFIHRWQKKAIVNSFWSIVDSVVNKSMIIIVTSFLLARSLKPANFGIFSVGISLAQTLWIFSEFGTTNYGIREIPRKSVFLQRQEVASFILSIRLLFSYVIFAGVLVYFLIIKENSKWNVPMIFCSIYILVYALYQDWYYKGKQKFKTLALANTVSTVFYALSVSFLIKSPTDLNLAAILWALAYLPGSIILWLLNSRAKEGLSILSGIWKISALMLHFKECILFFFVSISINLLNYIPIYLLSLFSNAKQVGYFSASYKLYLYFSSLFLPISYVFYPLLSEAFIENREEFFIKLRSFQKFSFITILPVALIIGIFSKELVLFLYGSAYKPSSEILTYLSLPIFLSTIRLPLTISIWAAEKQGYYAFATSCMCLFITLVGYFFIQINGLQGAAQAVLLGELVFIVLLFYLVRTYVSLSLNEIFLGYPIKAFVAFFFMCIVLFITKKTSIFVSAISAIIVYFITLFFLNELKIFGLRHTR